MEEEEVMAQKPEKMELKERNNKPQQKLWAKNNIKDKNT